MIVHHACNFGFFRLQRIKIQKCPNSKASIQMCHKHNFKTVPCFKHIPTPFFHHKTVNVIISQVPLLNFFTGNLTKKHTTTCGET